MYGKHFASAYTGSMLGAGADVFAVWGYCIANAVGGQVELNPIHVAALIGMTPEAVERAVVFLCAPDPRSRSTAEEGRRLVREGTFACRMPNWEAYRAVRNEEERRAYNRLKKAEQRGRDGMSKRRSMTPSPSKRESNLSAQAEAETEAEAGKTPRSSRGDVDKPKTTWLQPYENLWREHFSAALPFGQAAKVLKPLEAEHGSPAVLRALDNYLAAHTGERASYVSLPKFAAPFGQWLHPTAPKSRQQLNFEAIDRALPDEEPA